MSTSSFGDSLVRFRPGQKAANRRVVLAGASGLVGSDILRGLLDDPSVSEVHVISRREIEVRHPKIVSHVVNFGRLPELPPVDEVYLALGTTIRQAGSKAAFRAVDFDANLAVARACISAGARRIGLVSAISANAYSWVFYNRVKGELEDALMDLLPDTLVIARPSLLLGDRRALNQPTRFAERLAIWLSRLLEPILPANYRAVSAQDVARLLIAKVPASHGISVWSSGDIPRRKPTELATE